MPRNRCVSGQEALDAGHEPTPRLPAPHLLEIHPQSRMERELQQPPLGDHLSEGDRFALFGYLFRAVVAFVEARDRVAFAPPVLFDRREARFPFSRKYFSSAFGSAPASHTARA